MQISATIYPDTAAFKDITWSVVKPDSGSATISATGLLKATKNGNVYAKAVSVENPAIKDSVLNYSL